MVEKRKDSFGAKGFRTTFSVIRGAWHATMRDFFLSDNYSRLGAWPAHPQGRNVVKRSGGLSAQRRVVRAGCRLIMQLRRNRRVKKSKWVHSPMWDCYLLRGVAWRCTSSVVADWMLVQSTTDHAGNTRNLGWTTTAKMRTLKNLKKLRNFQNYWNKRTKKFILLTEKHRNKG